VKQTLFGKFEVFATSRKWITYLLAVATLKSIYDFNVGALICFIGNYSPIVDQIKLEKQSRNELFKRIGKYKPELEIGLFDKGSLCLKPL
jgi:hypothetical protein